MTVSPGLRPTQGNPEELTGHRIGLESLVNQPCLVCFISMRYHCKVNHRRGPSSLLLTIIFKRLHPTLWPGFRVHIHTM